MENFIPDIVVSQLSFVQSISFFYTSIMYNNQNNSKQMLGMRTEILQTTATMPYTLSPGMRSRCTVETYLVEV